MDRAAMSRGRAWSVVTGQSAKRFSEPRPRAFKRDRNIEGGTRKRSGCEEKTAQEAAADPKVVTSRHTSRWGESWSGGVFQCFDREHEAHQFVEFAAAGTVQAGA